MAEGQFLPFYHHFCLFVPNISLDFRILSRVCHFPQLSSDNHLANSTSVGNEMQLTEQVNSPIPNQIID